MDKWDGRVAIVTGASAGIGAALVQRLVKHGMKVVGCARNIQHIEELATGLNGEKGCLLAIKCDVSKEDDVISLMTRVREEFGGVDVCINNAGLAHSEPLLSGNTEQWRHMMEVNILGPAMFTREAVKDMRSRDVDDGYIININSLSGHRLPNSPGAHFYAATKHALTAMTEGVRCELRHLKSHIRISQVCPGLVETEFLPRMRNISLDDGRDAYSNRPRLDANDIVDTVVYQLSAPSNVQVHDVLIRPIEQMS